MIEIIFQMVLLSNFYCFLRSLFCEILFLSIFLYYQFFFNWAWYFFIQFHFYEQEFVQKKTQFFLCQRILTTKWCFIKMHLYKIRKSSKIWSGNNFKIIKNCAEELFLNHSFSIMYFICGQISSSTNNNFFEVALKRDIIFRMWKSKFCVILNKPDNIQIYFRFINVRTKMLSVEFFVDTG